MWNRRALTPAAGAAMAGLLGDLLVCAWLVPLLACREIGDRLSGFWGETGLALAWIVALPAGLGVAAWLAVPSAAVRYAIVVPAALVHAAALAWRRLSPAERRMLRTVHQGLVGPFRRSMRVGVR